MRNRFLPFLWEASKAHGRLPADGMRPVEFDHQLQEMLGPNYTLLYNARLGHWAVYASWPRRPAVVYVFYDYAKNEHMPLARRAIFAVRDIVIFNAAGAQAISRYDRHKQSQARDRELADIRAYLQAIVAEPIRRVRKRPVTVGYGS